MTTYYSNWKNETYTCRECSWQGLGKDLKQGETFEYLFEVDCPTCGGRISTISYPTIKESRANWDKLPEADKVVVELVEQNIANFEANKLRDTSQLPDIDDDSFVLDYSVKELAGKAEITYKDQVIFTQPNGWETWKTYIEILEILKAKYGDRLKDVVENQKDATRDALWGDYLLAPRYIAEAKDRLGLGTERSGK